MKLRELQPKDAPLILEWMQDPSINCFFRFNADLITEETVRAFVDDSQTSQNRHFAIADEDTDEYLGTISLKNITEVDAEYAIALRQKAIGTGAARDATMEILRYAFQALGLTRVYLNVYENNIRARKLYEKCGFFIFSHKEDAIDTPEGRKLLCWYKVEKDVLYNE